MNTDLQFKDALCTSYMQNLLIFTNDHSYNTCNTQPSCLFSYPEYIAREYSLSACAQTRFCFSNSAYLQFQCLRVSCYMYSFSSSGFCCLLHSSQFNMACRGILSTNRFLFYFLFSPCLSLFSLSSLPLPVLILHIRPDRGLITLPLCCTLINQV